MFVGKVQIKTVNNLISFQVAFCCPLNSHLSVNDFWNIFLVPYECKLIGEISPACCGAATLRHLDLAVLLAVAGLLLSPTPVQSWQSQHNRRFLFFAGFFFFLVLGLLPHGSSLGSTHPLSIYLVLGVWILALGMFAILCKYFIIL